MPTYAPFRVICVDDEASNESLKTIDSISARYIIDEDHEQIDLKLKALKDSIIWGKGLPLIFESAESLIAKTLEHFQHEEKILESVEYQGLPEHRAAHEVISKELREMKKELEQQQIQAALDLMKFYRAWLRKHLQYEDSKYAESIQSAAQRGRLVGRGKCNQSPAPVNPSAPSTSE